MFAVIVRLEKRLTRVQLEHDAPDGPHITRLGPSQFLNIFYVTFYTQEIQTKDDFWGAVVTSGNNGGVMFVVECCRTKVDETNSRILE